jgi:tryptophan-rich sensory protein
MVKLFLQSIGIFYGILIVVNIPAPFIGLEFENDAAPRLWYQPPGFVIPIVWFVLFALLALARTYLITQGQGSVQFWLFALAFLCATYANYTLGFAKLTNISALWFGLLGNLVVIGFAFFIIWKLYPLSRMAAYLTMPVIFWTVFASLIVVGEMKLQKLL